MLPLRHRDIAPQLAASLPPGSGVAAARAGRSVQTVRWSGRTVESDAPRSMRRK
uniref:Uncharacterized protein n=1 Tax=uncultured Armatimonadetes bacterium TaxID=157466 RepID=A0A6J4JAN4_9BACT|nr:hypothetical protein AVDCRST_MAG63-3148 [uncultured Armatimonadetes bacterium]